ncbi:ATP-binding domain-containing protein [Variovorax sp. efr-133-TYG-130]|uniref:DEAD/DEAH box helicase n=1 Tax=Variovorax sp. efr-133-TYG-130 TaxID=3040327 RepID=UPI0025539039|nr:ATP-binding domain-containing protein [Variovorax sp. efr-133-TYG-130]
MIDVIWGTAKDKPESSRLLAEQLAEMDAQGQLYIGYPIMGSPLGPVKFDALLISAELGLVAFDLVEGTEIGEYKNRQDDVASMLEVKFKPYPNLKQGRQLKFAINVITFAPAKTTIPESMEPYFIANSVNLNSQIKGFSWESDSATYSALVAAVQVVTSIRAGRLKREPKKPDSKGAKLKKVEDSIANLDQHQSQAVIETVEGVQRIRGLAGSGKTIILALKVAYLHSQNPEWKIGVTFNTRSLKEQFRRLINNFTIEQTGTEPDWAQIDILNAWGGPGGKERDGIYHRYCVEHGVDFMDYGGAKLKFGQNNELKGVCALALSQTSLVKPHYDLMLVDEAQDLPPEFLRLCYAFLRDPKRLVYAYDELQSLTGHAVLPPEELFGTDTKGRPLVVFGAEEINSPRQDIILEKCYRNSRPLLATAHALGFGIYRQSGLVQFFGQDSLWTDVGYVVEAGEIAGGTNVVLSRTPDTSPLFLEDHSSTDDLIQFIKFGTSAEQTEWLVNAIKKDISDEELRPEDIVVINPNPLTTQREVGPARQALFRDGVNNELAGVSTSADVFSKADAVTFTGIFRAKGNEAGMVYILNAQDCYSGWDKAATALVRNRIFTAITRSKAWVRVLGIGSHMDKLIEELNLLRENDFKLKFNYPTSEEKAQLRLINVGKTSRKRTKQRRELQAVLDAVNSGELDADHIIEQLKKANRPY